MAERRMFAKTIIDSDAFLEMPISTRLLYYDLSMRADDDGFVNSPKKIMKMIGATEDDLKMLILKKFIIPFEIGVVVIKHWRIHNYIRKDTYNETPYKEEKSMLELDENKSYRIKNQDRAQIVDEPSTQVRLGKVSICKDRLDDEIKEITKTYEENIGLLTPASAELLFSYLEDISSELIVQAIKIATQRNKRSAKYIEGILKDWILKGYKVLADIQNENNSEKKETVEQKKEYQEIEMTEEEFYSTGAKKNYE